MAVGLDWIRKYSHFFYTPIYFSFLMPELNANLALYLGDDILDDVKSSPSYDPERLRRKIILTALLSITLSALVQPMIIGALLALFLKYTEFTVFAASFALYRAYCSILAYRRFHEHAPATRSNLHLLALVYFVFVPTVAFIMVKAYVHARPFIEKHDWLRLIYSLGNAIYWDESSRQCQFPGQVTRHAERRDRHS